MAESNSQPIRCPCGFFGSAQTLGLCSKCFREREENRDRTIMSSSDAGVRSQNVTTSFDNSCPPASSSLLMPQMSSTQSTLSLCKSDFYATSSSNIQSSSSTVGLSDYSSHLTTPASSSSINPRINIETSFTSLPASPPEPVPPSEVESPPTSDLPRAASDSLFNRGTKRKFEEDDCANPVPQKNKRRCYQCNTRLDLALQAIGRCKCDFVFCSLHRLPEQHDCGFDHKETSREEARSKMIVFKKHVGTALKRLDSDS